MNIINITDDENNICNCTENNDMILDIVPYIVIISIIPCFLSIICCISFMIYSFIKLIKN